MLFLKFIFLSIVHHRAMELSEEPSSYYSILGVNKESSNDEIRHAYRRLAMQWHPDKWNRTPSLQGEAKKKFQEIQEAYSVLSDQRKRKMYDVGLYDPSEDDDDEVEGFADFVEEMAFLMENVRKEEKSYSIEELQSMLWEMVEDFDIPECSKQSWFDGGWSSCGPISFNDVVSINATTSSWEGSVKPGNPHLQMSCDMNRVCR